MNELTLSLGIGTFSVERISTLDLNSKALNHLVYPQRNKDLVCSLVEDHKRFANNQDDVIAGKGKNDLQELWEFNLHSAQVKACSYYLVVRLELERP
jgi:hypothetical protein